MIRTYDSKNMKIKNLIRPAALVSAFVIALVSFHTASAQTYNSYSGGYNTGYGTVYGSFGLAMATQNIYNTTQLAMQKAIARQALINKFGLAAVEKAEREAAAGKTSTGKQSRSSEPKIVVPPPPVVRNHGVYRPDPTVDTVKAFADALGETPEEKALVKQIYAVTKEGFDAEAAKKGWKNNIAAGITFFTVAAMTVYNDAPEPSDDAVNNYYKALNLALDEMPAFATVSNKDKQNFNNMMVGFGGLMLAGYLEGKQNNDAATLAAYKKVAEELVRMVLKTDAANLRVVDGQIVLK